MSDLIDRQAAIDAVRELYIQSPKISNDIVYDTAIDQAHDALVNLPSAQPELPEWAQKVEEYRKSAPSFVRNQLVWALYQTWKEYDGRLVHQRGKENR